MGYVPLFDHLTTGTLYGKWPDIGLWPVLLSMADRHGKIDVTPQFIAGVTGLEVEEVVACISRFCAPDPFSRTRADEGRRLEPIDPDRSWGWRVVNHAAYREKARLMAKDAARTASGVDAERKRAERARPPLSPEFPLSDSDTNTNKNPPSVGSAPKRATPRKRCPDDWNPDEYAVEAMRIECPDVNLETATRKFRDHEFARARKDWLATWRNWIREEQTRAAARPRLVQPAKRSPPTEEQISAERRKAAEANRRELAAKVGVIAAMPR